MAASAEAHNQAAAAAPDGTDEEDSVRYRSSCDRCQKTKVRCTRERPKCKRCVQKGVGCIYSPSRRLGRPRRLTSILLDRVGIRDPKSGRRFFPPGFEGNPPTGTGAYRTQHSILQAPIIRPIPSIPRLGELPRTTATTTTIITTHPSPPVALAGGGNGQGHDDHDAMRLVVDPLILNHKFPVADSHPSSAAADVSTVFDRPGCTDTQISRTTNCHIAILTQTTKLEQALVRTSLTPPIDLVLAAEREFYTLRRRLFTCAGHGSSLLSTGGADINPHFAPATSSRSRPCLDSNRPVLLSLALLGERVVGMLEDMFRLAAVSAHNMDQASQEFQWPGTPGLPPIPSPTARRLRSFRPGLPSPVVEASSPLKIGDFLVEGKAKSEAMRRILRLRAQRMLRGLHILEETRKLTYGTGWERGQSFGGPLDWGGSGALLRNTADTLVDDLIRRVESLQGAMTLV